MACPALSAGVLAPNGSLLEGANEIIKDGFFKAPAAAANALGGAAFKSLAEALNDNDGRRPPAALARDAKPSRDLKGLDELHILGTALRGLRL